MKSLKLLIFIQSILINILSDVNIKYIIYEENTNNPKVVSNSNNQIITFSSFNSKTYMSIFNSEIKPIKEHIELNFTYNSNAMIIEYKKENYLIVSKTNNDASLIYFNINNEKEINIINTNYSVSSYKLNLLSLKNYNSILLSYVSENIFQKKDLHIRKWKYNSEGIISDTNIEISFEINNLFINCIEFKNYENYILCEYIHENCQNFYIILYNEENNLIEISSPKNINISKEQTGCAFDKVINLIENNINEPEIGTSCFLESSKFYCIFWYYNSSDNLINLYKDNLNNNKFLILDNCFSYIEEADMTLVSDKKFIITCLSNNSDYLNRYIKVAIIEIISLDDFNFNFKTFSLKNKHADLPNIGKFHDNLYAIFYNIKGSQSVFPLRNEGNNIFELFNTILCSNEEYYISINETIEITPNLFYSEDPEIEEIKIYLIEYNDNNNIGEIKINNNNIIYNISLAIENITFIGKNTGSSYLKYRGISQSFQNTKECEIIFNICYKGCKKCIGLEKNSCTECSKDYYYKEEEKYNLTFECFTGEIDEYVLIDNSYIKCYENCIKCQNSSKDSSDQKCLKCKDNFNYLLYNLEKTYINCVEECPNIYATINQTCKNCKDLNLYHIKGEKNCISENEIPNSYYIIDDDIYNNLKECPNGAISNTIDKRHCNELCNKTIEKFYKDEKYNIKCIDDCNDDYPILEINNNQCVKNCLKDKSSFCNACLEKDLFLFNNQCVEDCPIKYNKNYLNHECEIEPYCILNIQEYFLNMDNDNIFNILNNIVNEYLVYTTNINKFKTHVNLFKGNNFIISIYRNETCQKIFAIENEYSYSNLETCKNKISSQRNINIYDIIIVQIEYNITENYTNLVFYEFFIFHNENNTYEEIDISICGENYINIFHPIKQFKFNISRLNYIKEKGFDPFDYNNQLFNDFCLSFYDERKRDVLLIDRQVDFFFNYNLCQDNCFKEFPTNLSYIKCSCNIQKNLIDKTNLKNPTKENFLKIKNKNYHIFKNNNNEHFYSCYNNFFKINIIKKNYFQIFYGILFILLIISYIIYISNNFKLITLHLSKFLKKNLKSNPPKNLNEESSLRNELKEKKTIETKMDSSLKNYYSSNDENSKNMSFHSFNCENINEIYTIETEEKNSSFKGKDNNYNKDKLNDKRKLFLIFKILFQKKIIYISIFYHRNIFETFIIQFIALILNIILIITINTMFFTKKRIRKRYQRNNISSLEYIIKNDLIYSFYSSLICSFLFSILQILYSGKRDFKQLFKKEKKNLFHFYQKSKIVLKNYKIRVYLFLSLIIIIFLFSVFYVSLFCSIFEKTQIALFESSLFSLFFHFLIQLLYINLIVFIRQMSLKFEIRKLYYLSKYLIDF